MAHTTKKLSKKFYPFVAVLLGLLMGSNVLVTTWAHADQYDEAINALRAQNNQSQAAANVLQGQADSYQGVINNLQVQINGIQASINTNKARQADLQAKITAAQAELERQKQVLGENIRQMYLEGQTTTLEMLASSQNLSDFVDKQEYRTSVQNKITDTLDQITTLKHQLNAQKDEVEKLLKDEQGMESNLAAQQSQQNSLLSYTQSQKDQYTSSIQANNGQISALRAAQLAANARFIGGAGTGPACGGGYPAKWCEIPQDTVLDNWGMYNRECVSYTAFRVAASGRFMPAWGYQAVGNANQWDDDARAEGIPVDTSPRPGDVAISNGGAYGHAMYVESVNGNGTINISQYNAALDGRFSTRSNLNPSGLFFIHF